jgi:dCMP deaminase
MPTNNIKMNRINWEEYALQIAGVARTRSEDPWKRVGVCILDKNNRVISTGYNGLAPGKVAPDAFWEDREKRLPLVIHAETNALSLVNNGEGFLLASTLMPCPACALNIAAHGIKKVIYKEVYQRSEEALKIFDFYNIEYKHIINTI